MRLIERRHIAKIKLHQYRRPLSKEQTMRILKAITKKLYYFKCQRNPFKTKDSANVLTGDRETPTTHLCLFGTIETE